MKKYLTSLVVLFFVLTGCSLNNNVNEPENKPMQSPHTLDVNTSDFIKEQSIHDAVRSRDFNIVKLLIEQNSNVNKKDKYGYTPLHLAVRFNELEIAKLLFNNGAKINTIDKYGDTPLLDSTRNKFTNVSEFLICNGAYKNVSDDHKRTPLNYASITNDLYIANLLRQTNFAKVCKNMTQLLINEINTVNTKNPEICGTVTSKINENIEVSLENSSKKKYGPYIAEIKEDNTWCVQVKDDLQNATYKVTALVKSQSQKDLLATESFEVLLGEKVSNNNVPETFTKEEQNEMAHSLYEALKDEFEDDFSVWNAQLDEETMVFRFKSPHLMFEQGNSKLREEYKKYT